MYDKAVIRGQRVRERILKEIITYYEQHGYAPSFREIGNSVGLKSSATIHTHVKVLIAEGKLETDHEFSTPRALRVPGYKFVKE